MKTTITICIDTEIAQLLKEEKNISALINSYLIHYFGLKNKNSIPKEEQIKTLEQKKEQIISELSSLDKSITTTKEVLEQEIVTKQEEQSISESKRLELLNSYQDNVRTFCDVTEEEVNSIALMYEAEKDNYDTFFLWCQDKGIKLLSES